MYLFLISFIAIYGGMHAYVFSRINASFSPARHVTIFLTLLFVFMTFAPLLVRLSERADMDSVALSVAWPCYIWMGFIFILISLFLILDTVRAVCWIAHFFFPLPSPTFLTTGIFTTFVLLTAVVASCYAFYEALQIRSQQVVVSTSKLLPEIKKVRIAQITDVHLGLLFREKRLERVLKVIREAKPDIIVSTGDLVDGKLNREDVKFEQQKLSVMLASLQASGGKFAVAGNHESHAGLKDSISFTSAAGFTLLRNKSEILPNGIAITGVDDQAITGKGEKARNAEKKLLENIPKNKFHLLLKHRPVIPESSDGLFDLQLSGHVHKGQIFPFNLLVKLEYPIKCGTTRTKSGSRIHVSRGTGTWGPPMRLFAPPEVTIIDIVADKNQPTVR